MYFGIRLVAADIDVLIRVLIRSELELDIFRKVYDYDSGLSGPCDIKSLLDGQPRSSRRLTVVDHLLIFLVMPTMSASWKASFPIRFIGTCPVKQTKGTES